MSGVDRAALIEAVDEAINRPTGTYSLRAGERALDAVLPLVAQTIDGEAHISTDQTPAFEVYRSGWNDGIAYVSRLVRSLAEEGQQQ